MPTTVKGQPTSEEVIARLAAEQRTVCVAMSLGKDAIATQIALARAGIPTEMAYLYLVPPGPGQRQGLAFIEGTIHYLEDRFDQRIHAYPHPSIYRWLNNAIFQPPERLLTIEAAQLPTPTYEQMWDLIKADLSLPPDTWVADGVRAADSIVRRASLVRHGVMKPAHHKVSPIHDWLKHEVLDAITSANIRLPIDYELFGRSFDGIDARFTGPLRDHLPDDYQRLLDWYPLAEADLFRQELIK